MPQTTEQFLRVFNTVKLLQPSAVFVEDVHSLFGMSAKSNFEFGGWVRSIQNILGMAVHPDNITLIQPKDWQKEIGLSFPKKCPTKERKILAADYAVALRPSLKEHIFGPRGGLLDGNVDAFLMAQVALNRREKHEATFPS